MKNPYYNPAKKHHRPDGFQNNYQSFRGKRWHEILRWRWQAWRAGHPRPLQAPIPVVAPDLDFIHANAQAGLAMQPAATWIGHITVLLQIGGLNLLTDPVFSERCFPVQWAGPQRQTPPGLRLDQLPPIDVVLLSHNHYDHFEEHTLRALAQTPAHFIVPLGLGAYLKPLGVADSAITELDWWQHAQRGDLRITLVPALHTSGAV